MLKVFIPSLFLASLALMGMKGCSSVPTASTNKVRTTDNNVPERAEIAIKRNRNKIKALFNRRGASFEQPIFMRAFKEEGVIEVWGVSRKGGRYRRVKNYPICAYSGTLGQKQKEGDLQTPEGFYKVKPGYMNPHSAFHLSFDIGFPNAYDKAQGWTGSDLMVHGDCISRGCYAMTDDNMEELYTIATLNFEAGHDNFDFHAFPFRMTAANLRRHGKNRWMTFWLELRNGYSAFEASKKPPLIQGKTDGYHVTMRR